MRYLAALFGGLAIYMLFTAFGSEASLLLRLGSSICFAAFAVLLLFKSRNPSRKN